MNLGEYFEGIRVGDILLVEYSSRAPFPMVFHAIASSCRNRPILIVDTFDTFISVKRALEVAREDISYLQEAHFIKGGGRIKWPNTLKTFDVYRDVGVYLGEVGRFFTRYYRKHPETCSFFFGVERLQRIAPNEARFILNVYALMSTFLESNDRTAVHFVNTDIADGRYLGLVEEVAGRVLAVRSGFVEVIKSPVAEEKGLRLTF